MTRSAVVLLSGGLDLMVCAALAREAGFSVIGLTIDYGQRHRIELELARVIAGGLDRPADRPSPRPAGVRRIRADRRCRSPKVGVGDGIPVTYVPARNTIFLSLALGLAEVTARAIFSSA